MCSLIIMSGIMFLDNNIIITAFVCVCVVVKTLQRTNLRPSRFLMCANVCDVIQLNHRFSQYNIVYWYT